MGIGGPSNLRESTTITRGMHREFLSLLHCPYCGFTLELESAGSSTDAIEYSVLRCACYEYPIVEGIPILQQIDGLQRVVQLIRQREHKGALLRALDLFMVQMAPRSKLHRIRSYWNCLRLVSKANISFCSAAHLVRRPSIFADYLVHRYANPSFLAAIGPLMLLSQVVRPAGFAHESGRTVLDMACGAGHATFLMRTLYPELTVISADQDFVNVYLTRRYMSPNGLQLCIDAQIPSPLPDQYFDAVFCQDAFHYFRSKKAVVREIKRVSREDALWIFPHLHNRLVDNLVPGSPLSPESYLECFEMADARLFGESELLKRLAHERVFDLSSSVPPSSLNESPALTLIRGGGKTWRTYRYFPKEFCGRRADLRVNPIYHSYRRRGECVLELRWPNPVMARECAEVETVLLRSCKISMAHLAQLAEDNISSDLEWLDELVTKFVLVPLPSDYTLAP